MKLKSIFTFFSIIGPVFFLIVVSPTVAGLDRNLDTPNKCLRMWLVCTDLFEAFLLMLYSNKTVQDCIKRGL